MLEPVPAGRGRLVGEQNHEHLMRWCREFAADVGEVVTIDAASWAGTRFAEKRYTFWETPDGTPVSMAGVNPMVAGQVRLDPVYTPAHLRGRGYAGAVTVEVSRAALTAGATDVMLFTNAANPTSNALYQRIGYLPITDWARYDFAYAQQAPLVRDQRVPAESLRGDVCTVGQVPDPGLVPIGHSDELPAADQAGHDGQGRLRCPAACSTDPPRKPG